MKVRMSIAAVGAAALLGSGAFVLPAVASVRMTAHTIKFTSVQQRSAKFSKTAVGESDIDYNKAGKIVGFDTIYFSFDPQTHQPSGGVTLDTNGGFLYATLNFTQSKVIHGTVTGGTGKFAGATGTITAKSLNKKGTRTAVTITYQG
jgi:hypothetical protein